MFLDDQPRPLGPEQQRLLRETVITDSQPGTVLRDFQALLDFVAAGQPLQVSGGHDLLPIKILPELNARLAEPFVLNLQRPQLRSYPNLQALYLLLRASGIGVVRGSGAARRLHLDPTTLESWNALNPTEKYFNLLEAWIVHSDPEMIDERGGGFYDEPLMHLSFGWQRIPKGGLTPKCDPNNPLYDAYVYAMMAFFGFAHIEQRAPRESRSLVPAPDPRAPLGRGRRAAPGGVGDRERIRGGAGGRAERSPRGAAAARR